jgi:hypothetical protein
LSALGSSSLADDAAVPAGIGTIGAPDCRPINFPNAFGSGSLVKRGVASAAMDSAADLLSDFETLDELSVSGPEAVANDAGVGTAVDIAG